MKSLKKAYLSSSISLTMTYILLSLALVLFSEHMIVFFYPSLKPHSEMFTIEGVIFVFSTAFFMFWLMETKNSRIIQQFVRKKNLMDTQRSVYLNTIDSLVDLMESRDAYTAGHSRRVALYCRLIADEMGLMHHEKLKLERAAVVHDIGKIAIPDSILLKPYKLNSAEYDLIKLHVEEGYKVLQHIPYYTELAEIVRYHHERYDGSGYPEGKKGEEIPLLSQIMAVADSFDAMTTSRIYKPFIDLPKALGELKKLSGIAYHPDVVDAALKALSKINLDEAINQSPITRIEEERMSYYFKDSLTGFYTAAFLQYLLNQPESDLGCMESYAVDMHAFADYNTQHGWSAGDRLIQQVAKSIEQAYPNSIKVRFHGDSFLILCTKEMNIAEYAASINRRIADTGVWISIHRVSVKDALNAEKEIHHWLTGVIHPDIVQQVPEHAHLSRL